MLRSPPAATIDETPEIVPPVGIEIVLAVRLSVISCVVLSVDV
jgi:hypothetical protein